MSKRSQFDSKRITKSIHINSLIISNIKRFLISNLNLYHISCHDSITIKCRSIAISSQYSIVQIKFLSLLDSCFICFIVKFRIKRPCKSTGKLVHTVFINNAWLIKIYFPNCVSWQFGYRRDNLVKLFCTLVTVGVARLITSGRGWESLVFSFLNYRFIYSVKRCTWIE